MPKPIIDHEKCDLCGTCEDICPMSVFKKDDKQMNVAKPDECIGCRACEVQCPKKAIQVVD